MNKKKITYFVNTENCKGSKYLSKINFIILAFCF